LQPEREAGTDGDQRFSYEQFFDRCDRGSSDLQRLGLRPGDRVVYIAPNTHALLEGFYAVPQLGAVLVPLNYRLTPADFAYMINHCGARLVCAHSDHLEAVEGIRKELPAVELFVALEGARDGWLDYEASVASSPAAFARPPISERDLLTINYTSGTTSRPKGVMITHRNAYLNSVGTPGAPPAAATIQRVEGDLGWVITQVYGLTETAPFITVCEPRPEHEMLGPEASAAVKARQGVELLTSGELLVVDPAGAEVPHDGRTMGEIVVRGNVVMQGYYDDPEATARAFEGGYFHTGDAAVVHPDGYAEIRDRFKDVIISGGE